MTARTRTITQEELKPGQAVVFLSATHLITSIEPYTHPTLPGAFGIARAADGWGMSLWRGHLIDVAEVDA